MLQTYTIKITQHKYFSHIRRHFHGGMWSFDVYRTFVSVHYCLHRQDIIFAKRS